jgi:hypothetical protein
LGFIEDDNCSLINGEKAYQAVKDQVEDIFKKYNDTPAQLPSITISDKKTSIA